MSNRIASTLPRIAGRTFVNPVRRNAALSVPKLVAQRTHNVSASTIRTLTISARQFKGIYPETDNPQTKDPEPEVTVSEPTPLTPEEYHENADKFIDHLVATLEELQESREDVDVEYSAGVLTLAFPPKGTYVINKQPPNKQIWLSSPITGPKRFDWVVLGEAQNQKEGGGSGEWIYLRDGTTLSELLENEIGINLAESLE